MAKFVGVRAKTYSYLQMTVVKIKKAKVTKNSVIKKNLNLKILKTVQKQLNMKIK